MVNKNVLIVKMGNDGQVSRSHEEEVIPLRWVNDNIFYAIAKQGIACVTINISGKYSCTHLMPWSYSDWIESNWGITVDENMRKQASTLMRF